MTKPKKIKVNIGKRGPQGPRGIDGKDGVGSTDLEPRVEILEQENSQQVNSDEVGDTDFDYASYIETLLS